MDRAKSLVTFFTEASNTVSMPASSSDGEIKKSKATSVGSQKSKEKNDAAWLRYGLLSWGSGGGEGGGD
ncbi:hypothetical protein N7475_008865 [Penicillium sp. IBT 31633x]|nr:hypothetical protein N7475_008865 [Penicillium sp. IBT 31633x]